MVYIKNINQKAEEPMQPKELTLADHLAIDRTLMANERTLLAYARSAFALFIAGLSVLKFFGPEFVFLCIAWSFIGFAPVLFLVGIYRSWRTHKKLKQRYQ